VSERALIAEGLLAKVAERLAVLGQVVRLRLGEQLAAGSATLQELADTLGLTQQNVSKHLQILCRDGPATRRPDGANVIYALRDESTVRLLEDVITGVAEHLRDLSRLAAGVAQDRADDDDSLKQAASEWLRSSSLLPEEKLVRYETAPEGFSRGRSW
jgi:DNA-binding transcriptional ArsR family regulator